MDRRRSAPLPPPRRRGRGAARPHTSGLVGRHGCAVSRRTTASGGRAGPHTRPRSRGGRRSGAAPRVPSTAPFRPHPMAWRPAGRASGVRASSPLTPPGLSRTRSPEGRGQVREPGRTVRRYERQFSDPSPVTSPASAATDPRGPSARHHSHRHLWLAGAPRRPTSSMPCRSSRPPGSRVNTKREVRGTGPSDWGLRSSQEPTGGTTHAGRPPSLPKPAGAKRVFPRPAPELHRIRSTSVCHVGGGARMHDIIVR